jgi:hypothetical protein
MASFCRLTPTARSSLAERLVSIGSPDHDQLVVAPGIKPDSFEQKVVERAEGP